MRLQKQLLWRPLLTTLAAVALTALGAGCGGSSPVATPATKPAGDSSAPGVKRLAKVPAPKGDTILKLSKVAAANGPRGVAAFDFETLDGLAKHEAVVYEPFLKRDIRFRGILVKDLLAAAGAPESAGSVFFHALDDYTVTISIPDLVGAGGMIATTAAGKPMKIAKGGPIRLVFTDETKVSRNTDNWAWSIDSMALGG